MAVVSILLEIKWTMNRCNEWMNVFVSDTVLYLCVYILFIWMVLWYNRERTKKLAKAKRAARRCKLQILDCVWMGLSYTGTALSAFLCDYGEKKEDLVSVCWWHSSSNMTCMHAWIDVVDDCEMLWKVIASDCSNNDELENVGSVVTRDMFES